MAIVPLPALCPEIEWILWDMEEPLAFFLEHTSLTDEEIQQVGTMLGKRQKEFVVQRFLIQRFLKNSDIKLLNTSNGKPYLSDPIKKISISHSKHFLMASFSNVDHGIDLEWIDARIIRLAYKFCDHREIEIPPYTTDVVWYTVIWSIKESLYKCDGMGQLDFIQQIKISFTPESYQQGWGIGIVKRTVDIYYKVYFTLHEGFVISCAYPEDVCV